MSRDLEPEPIDDDELHALFAVMREDRAPADLEERLLGALAATSVAAAAGAAVKVGFWHKVAALMNTYGVASSAIVGALSGVMVCGIYAAVDARAPDPPAPRAPLTASASPIRGAPPSIDARAVSAPSAAPRASAEVPLATPGKPITTPSGPAPAASTPPELTPPDPAPPPATATVVEATPAPREPTDMLREELRLVRAIAALVDGGRCAEARAAIAQYTAAHARGQLSGEVAVLAARCRGR